MNTNREGPLLEIRTQQFRLRLFLLFALSANFPLFAIHHTERTNSTDVMLQLYLSQTRAILLFSIDSKLLKQAGFCFTKNKNGIFRSRKCN